MYGFLKPRTPAGEKDFQKVYRGYYCSVCSALRNRYGGKAAMMTSHDALFTSLLTSNAKASFVEFRGKCPVNPLRKISVSLSDPMFDRAADMSVLLGYFKAIDHIEDRGGLRDKLFYRFYGRTFDRMKTRVKESCGLDMKRLHGLFRKQASNEKDDRDQYEVYAESSAEGLKYILQASGVRAGFISRTVEVLGEFGKRLGRMIYLLDACLDFKKDVRRRYFNAVLNCFTLQISEDVMAVDIRPIREAFEKEMTILNSLWDELTELPNYEICKRIFDSSLLVHLPKKLPETDPVFNSRIGHFLTAQEGIIEECGGCIACCFLFLCFSRMCCGKRYSESDRCVEQLCACWAIDTFCCDCC